MPIADETPEERIDALVRICADYEAELRATQAELDRAIRALAATRGAGAKIVEADLAASRARIAADLPSDPASDRLH